MASFDKRAFGDGVRTALPVVVSVLPFGILFGALAVDNGMTTFEAALMSATIFAGASQMVGIQLFGTDIAPWIIVFSVFAVNFRHILYSATVGRYFSAWSPAQQAVAFFFLTDPQFAETERRGEQGLPMSFSWYLGMGFCFYIPWIALSVVGAQFGRLIPDPEALGMDFLLPIYFLGLVVGFRKRANWLPVVAVSAAASIAAFYLVGSPWHVSIGAMAGILLTLVLPLPPGIGQEKAVAADDTGAGAP